MERVMTNIAKKRTRECGGCVNKRWPLVQIVFDENLWNTTSSPEPSRLRMNMYPNISRNIPNNSVRISPLGMATITRRKATAPNPMRSIRCAFSFCSRIASFWMRTMRSARPAGTERTRVRFHRPRWINQTSQEHLGQQVGHRASEHRLPCSRIPIISMCRAVLLLFE